MLHLVRLLVVVVATRFKSRTRLEAEVLVLRHQLGILRRQARKRVALSGLDRQIFVLIYRLFPSAAAAVTIIRPDTIVRWHRAGFRAYWRWRSKPRWGRPKIPVELRRLIREMSLDNSLWGAPRIHGELLKLGFDIGQTTVVATANWILPRINGMLTRASLVATTVRVRLTRLSRQSE